MRKPVHQHSCNKCNYLATVVLYAQVWDIYFCTGSYGDELIMRFDSKGESFVSTPVEYARGIAGDNLYNYALNVYDASKGDHMFICEACRAVHPVEARSGKLDTWCTECYEAEQEEARNDQED